MSSTSPPPPPSDAASAKAPSIKEPPVIVATAIAAADMPKGRLMIADLTTQLPEEAQKAGHPGIALFAKLDPSLPDETLDNFAPLLVNGLPEMYVTQQEAEERVRFFQHAAKHGAMLTLGGLQRLLQQIADSGVPANAPVCFPIVGDDASLTMVRLGSGRHMRLQMQHMDSGMALDAVALRDAVVLEPGVFPPMHKGGMAGAKQAEERH